MIQYEGYPHRTLAMAIRQPGPYSSGKDILIKGVDRAWMYRLSEQGLRDVAMKRQLMASGKLKDVEMLRIKPKNIPCIFCRSQAEPFIRISRGVYACDDCASVCKMSGVPLHGSKDF